MVLVRQARQSATFSGVFCNFHFCVAMARVYWRLWKHPFGTRRFRARSRGLQSLCAIRPMVFARRARQNGSNRGFVAPSLQSLHQVCKVCTKSAKSPSGTLNAHFIISLWKQMHTLCRLCKHLVKTLSMHTRCRLTPHLDFRTMCRLIAHFFYLYRISSVHKVCKVCKCRYCAHLTKKAQ